MKSGIKKIKKKIIYIFRPLIYVYRIKFKSLQYKKFVFIRS